jgi:hypothetical protein
VAALLCAGLAACTRETAPADGETDAFTAASDLRADLVAGGHIDLRWKNHAREAGGQFVEFNMQADEAFTLLEAVPGEATTLRHPDVAAETAFSYRVRTVFGRASDVVEVATQAAPPSGAPPLEEGALPPEPDAAPSALVRSLRNAETIAEARPAGLTVALAATTTADLRWKDRASDEGGYLVEMAASDAREFKVCALLPADATSFRKIQLPPNARVRFRVRAYFLGAPSNVARLTTPPSRM